MFSRLPRRIKTCCVSKKIDLIQQLETVEFERAELIHFLKLVGSMIYSLTETGNKKDMIKLT